MERTLLTLGRGEVYFHKEGDVGERYIGNTPSFQIARSIERLEVQRAYSGRKHLGRSKVISESIDVKMVTDHMSRENVDLWLTSDGVPTYAGDEFLTFTENVLMGRGRFYQLGGSVIPGGYQFVDSAVLRIAGVKMVLGVDYLFDRDKGRIQILSDAPMLDSAKTVSVTFIKRPSLTSVTAVEGREIYGSLRYIAKDPYGPRVDYWFPQVRITPKGAVDLKGDEFRQLQFDIEAVRLGPASALLYALQDGQAPKPITADSVLVTADSTVYRSDNGRWG